jgi:hypothetical protein
LILIRAEKIIAQDANILENKLPPNDSIISHVNTMVSMPKSAGKSLIQNIPPPRSQIILEITAIKGGTEIYPNARWSAWLIYRNSSL